MLRAVSCIPIENTTSHPVVYRLASLGVEPSPGVSYDRFMHTGPSPGVSYDRFMHTGPTNVLQLN